MMYKLHINMMLNKYATERRLCCWLRMQATITTLPSSWETYSIPDYFRSHAVVCLSVCLSVVRLSVDDHQFGSLKRRSTTHALHGRYANHWHKSLDEGQSMRVLFVDCAKAFDHVDHNVLL